MTAYEKLKAMVKNDDDLNLRPDEKTALQQVLDFLESCEVDFHGKDDESFAVTAKADVAVLQKLGLDVPTRLYTVTINVQYEVYAYSEDAAYYQALEYLKKDLLSNAAPLDHDVRLGS